MDKRDENEDWGICWEAKQDAVEDGLRDLHEAFLLAEEKWWGWSK
eukprot:SAG31_NODE_10890_length_1086_cov_2.610942_2_plen_45_part_00